jgi:hypothetical protein
MNFSSSAASKIAMLSAGATAVVALSACQSHTSGAASEGTGPQASQSTSVTSPQASQPLTPRGETQTPQGSAVSGGDTRRCTAADLSAEIIDQGPIAGAQTASWMLIVTNKSGHTCAVNGYPSFGLEDGSGTLWSDSRTQYVRHPGAPVKISLKPRVAAFAGVKWALCNTGDLAGGLVFTPPGDTAHVKVTVTTESDSARLKLFRLCGHSVTAGSLQPIRQGVVFAS